MIPEKQAKILRKFVGPNYSVKLTEYFREKGLKNREGNFYSTPILTRVFNGKVNHAIIEKHIWEFIEELTEKRKAEKERQEELLSSAKELTNE